MAITETRPETLPASHANPWGEGDEYPSFTQALGSGDHKTLGRSYVGLSLLFGIAAWVLAALHSSHQIEDFSLLEDDTLQQVFTLSRVALVFLFVMPIFLGLATFVVPLQVGASTVAFPRAAALAFWNWLAGSVILLVGFGINGGIGGGDEKGVLLGYLGIGLAAVALLLGTVCVLTTIITLRTPGMRLDRVPLFTWSILVAGMLWLVTVPVFLANVLLIYVDYKFGAPSDFGLGPSQWAQLEWLFWQPQVFAFAIPVVGIISDVIATASGARMKNRGLMLVGIGAFGILTFGAYAQVFFAPDVHTEWLFVGQSVVLVLPLLLLFGGWLTTMRAGKPRLTAAAVVAPLSGVVLLLGAVASILFAIEPLELQPSSADTATPYFQWGVLLLVGGAATAAAIAGLQHWAPKMWGRLANNGLGVLGGLLAVVGGAAGGLALCVSAFQARFDGLRDATDALNGIAGLGAALAALGVLVAAVSLLGRGGDAGDDPWGGQTLEWATSSPPPPGNFGELAPVTSPEPLFDDADRAEEDAS